MYLHRPHPPPLTPTFPAAFSVCPPTRLIQSGLPQDASIGGIWTYETQPNSDAVDHAGSDIVVETDSSGNVTREALFGPGVDRLEYLKVGSTTVAHRFPLEDARGSVLNVVDEQGSTTTTFSYSAFGETTRTSGEAFPYAFTGRRYFKAGRP